MFPWIFPLFSVRFNFFRLAFIKKALRKNHYDLIIFDFSQTFLFSKFINGIPVIFYSHDVIAQRYSRADLRFMLPFIKISEKIMLNKRTARIFVPSEKDKEIVDQLYSIKTFVTDVYIDSEIRNAKQSSTGEYFVFFANWNRPDNSDGLRWFMESVYPALGTKVSFKIIGTGLPDDLLKFISAARNIEYLGFMDNPYEIISNARALVSPLFTGAGVKVKVIESLACGNPIIGTSLSFEGIPERFSKYMLVAENSSEFIALINTYRLALSERISLKESFLKSYTNKGISAFINSESLMSNL
jgi:glycosyltransferase involved in cell wall biosynthesis